MIYIYTYLDKQIDIDPTAETFSESSKQIPLL